MLDKILHRSLLLGITFGLLMIGMTFAQEETDITIFIDEDSLTVFVDGNQTVSLSGLSFEVNIDGNWDQIFLEDYQQFNVFRFERIPTPVCFRLQRANPDQPLPSVCPRRDTIIQPISSGEIFWWDDLQRQTRTLNVLENDNPLDFCPAGQARCEITYVPYMSPEQLAQQGVTTNSDWVPFEREFDGVTMVLVPAGCFDMGNDNGDEQPIHEICFDEPFWIDKYEVTNERYGSTRCESTSSEPNQPRNCVDWFEASDFCETRSARLPTEAEWEYAARGPDSLAYPWGNEWNPDNANWADTSPDETFPVGSFPEGESWVGAMDMSGNVWEWVSSLYLEYPYDSSHESSSDTNSARVLRGGSWRDSVTNVLRAAFRVRYVPDDANDVIGFRCARY